MTHLPNTFIIGAPRCGTTSLAHYLGQHPQIFFSSPKEPHYFSTDFSENFRSVTTDKDYARLFEKAPLSASIIAEGSIMYLSSKVATPAILDSIPDAKFIVMIRNPVEMAYSLHGQNLRCGDESEPIFEKAWREQGARSTGQKIPVLCKDSKVLQYKTICSTGTQLRKLYERVPKEHVLVLLFDDFVAQTRSSYLSVLHFLNLPDDGRTDFQQQNKGRTSKSARLERFILRPPAALKTIAKFIPGLKPFFKQIHRANATKHLPMTESFRQELTKNFEPEIHLLEDLLGRNLSHWLRL